MYYIGIITPEYLAAKMFWPSYVLSYQEGKCRIVDNDWRTWVPKALFQKPQMSGSVIDAMSNRRITRDGQTTVLTGGLFWFQCDEYGRDAKECPVIFVKTVPDKKCIQNSPFLNEDKKTCVQLLTEDSSFIDLMKQKKMILSQGEANDEKRKRITENCRKTSAGRKKVSKAIRSGSKGTE